MKKLVLLLIGLGTIGAAQAQKKAITELGEEVVLYDDGTWKYLDGENLELQEETIIPTNPKAFTKSDEATFLLKSSKVNLGFWLDPKLWKFKKAVNNEDAEYELQLKDGDLYGMIITEKIEIPLETLKVIALENGRAAAPDLEIVKEEYRTVNGLKVLMLQMNGTIQGIQISYIGYYYSNPKGTMQMVTYTSQNLLEEYRDALGTLLNGVVEVD